jgi:hypothetical protein
MQMSKLDFVSELAKLRSSSTFLQLKGYKNDHGEVANYNIVFHISYESAIKRSVDILNSIVPEDDIQATAKKQLLESFDKSLTKAETTPVEEIDDAYTRFFDNDGSYIKGVKLHRETNTLHLYGLVNSKKVIIPVVYPKKNKQALTVAKDKLRSMLPVNKFRQFKITPDSVEKIIVEHLELLPPA